MEPNLESTIESLLGNFTHLSARIKHLSFNTDACGERIDGRCSYISFRDGQQTFDDFIDTISEHIIPFCIPRVDIEEAQNKLKNGDYVEAGRVMTNLSNKARALFIKAKKGCHRSGEAGEILLYLLTEWLLSAPRIVSKMYLKTNSNMPVHGTDGIHARFDNTSGNLYLYWGESKAHVKMNSALSSALESISEFITSGHDKREIEIVSTYSDFNALPKETKEAFLTYLDPYAEQSNNRITIYSCLLVFELNLPKDINSEQAEAKFINLVSDSINTFIGSIKDDLKRKSLNNQRFEFFLVPVPSVQDFRDKFQEKIGWPNDK